MATSRRDKADYFTLLARKEGYPARSVYKLKEINEKERIIKSGDTVLDVGAAPGSWTLFVSREILHGSGKIVSVDLNPLSINPIPINVISFTGDAFTKEMIFSLTNEGPYDVVISDAAPMTTGNRTVDTLRSETLAENVVLLADKTLNKGGNIVIKIFQGGGQETILKELREKYKKAKAFKPKACREDSFEIYLIGLEKIN